jgi:hypothetical protein
MVSHRAQHSRHTGDPAVRGAAAIGLFSVGVIHALVIQGALGGVWWLAAGFAALAIVQPAAGLWLLARPSAPAWAVGGVLCLAAAAGYVLTRSVAVPGDTDDHGDWLNPLGLASLIAEGIVVILAVMALTQRAERQQDRQRERQEVPQPHGTFA